MDHTPGGAESANRPPVRRRNGARDLEPDRSSAPWTPCPLHMRSYTATACFLSVTYTHRRATWERRLQPRVRTAWQLTCTVHRCVYTQTVVGLRYRLVRVTASFTTYHSSLPFFDRKRRQLFFAGETLRRRAIFCGRGSRARPRPFS